MQTKHRILAGLATALLLAGGIGAGMALAERGPDGMGDGGPRMGEHEGRGWGGRSGWWRGGARAAPTQEEIDTRLRERFARMDRNSDGIIDRAEIEAMMGVGGMGAGAPGGKDDRGRGGGRGPHAGGPDGPDGAGILRRFDENKDGKVTKEEFLNGIKRRFAEMDLNNDGKITDDDLPPILRGRGVLTAAGDGGPPGAGRMGGRSGEGRSGEGPSGDGITRMLRWLKAADANKDGVITLEEVLAHAEKQFASMDRNKDGVLDQADRDIVRKEMTDYRVQRYLHAFGADKEGQITRDQFFKVGRERVARMELGGGDGGGGGWMGHRGERMRHHGGRDGGPDGGGDRGRGRRGESGRGESGRGDAGRGEPGRQETDPPGAAPVPPSSPPPTGGR